MSSELFKLRKPLILWCAATLFFASQFVMRLFVGVIREDISYRFGVDTIAFGTFAFVYYIGYSFMQVPVGFLLDKFNFRYVTFAMILLSSLGTYLLKATESWHIVLISRFLVGAGSAAGFLAVSKVIKSFFPDRVQSMMIAFSFTFGLLGALLAGRPMKALYLQVGYDMSFTIISAVVLLVGFIILLVNDKNIDQSEEEGSCQVTLSKTFQLIFNPKILLIGLFGGFLVGPLEGFADFWGKLYFMHVENFLEDQSIDIVFTVYLGLVVGGPILTLLADYFKSNTLMIFLTGLVTVIIFLIMFYVVPLSKFEAMSLMFVLGIMCCYQVLVFSLVTKLVTKDWASLSIAVVNCLNMLFGSFFHKIIPYLMVSLSSPEVNAMSNPTYEADVYIKALSVIPILSLVGTLGFIYLSMMEKRGKLKKIEL